MKELEYGQIYQTNVSIPNFDQRSYLITSDVSSGTSPSCTARPIPSTTTYPAGLSPAASPQCGLHIRQLPVRARILRQAQHRAQQCRHGDIVEHCHLLALSESRAVGDE